MPRVIRPGQLGVEYSWQAPGLPDVVSDAILEAAKHMGDALPVLVAARHAIITDVRERFDTETDPRRRQWTAWKPPYRHSGTILRRPPKGTEGGTTGERSLFEAMTDPGSWPIAENSLFLEQDAIYTHYGAAHNAGLGKMPKRQFIGFTPFTRHVVAGLFQGYFVDGTIAIYERGGRMFRQAIEPFSKRFASKPVPIL